MRSEHYALDVPTTLDAGESRETRQLHDKWLFVVGVAAATATIRVEGTGDDATWMPLAVQAVGADPVTNITTDGFFEIPQNTLRLRVVVASVGSGTADVGVTLVGRMAHG